MTYRLPHLPLQVHVAGSYARSGGPQVQGHDLQSHWITAAVGAGVFGTWPALSVAGSAELELGYRRIDVDFKGQSSSDEEVPVRLRTLLSVPADGTVAATFGAVLRLPPQNPKSSSGFSVQSPAVAVEAVAGLEVRL